MEWTPIFQRIAAEYTQDNWILQSDNSIEENNQGYGWKTYIRRTCASFRCRSCRRTWPSNKVMVIFHMHLNNQTHQGIVKVRCFRQNCKICADAPMEQPQINADNVSNLLESLMKNIRKKFYDEEFEEMDREPQGVEVQNPHEPDHCEGCRAGICNRDKPPPNHGGGRGGRGGRGRGYRRN